MRELLIKTNAGNIEALSDYQVARNDGVNGEKTVSVSVTKTELNNHSYPMIQNLNYYVYDGEEYIIHGLKENTKGKTVRKECTAIHRIFDDLAINRQYTTISGAKKINVLMDFALKDSGYSYVVDMNEFPNSVDVDNFGDNDSKTLFQDILTMFGAEFDVNQRVIYLAKKIGRETDEQLRHQFNIKDPSKEINTTSFFTYIKGFGKQNENGSYVVTAEYTSPLAEIYNKRHAEPVRDERFTNKDSLLAEMKRKLNDSIEISLSLSYIQLKEMGITDIRKGDYLWCIIEPFEIDTRIRVVNIEDYEDENKTPVYQLGSISKKASDVLASFSSASQAITAVIDTKTKKLKESSVPASLATVVKTIDGITTDGGFNLEKSVGRLPDNQVSVGPNTEFAPGYDPSQNTSYGEATEQLSGLMSAADKRKINQISIEEGQVVNLSFLLQTINELQNRIEALEGGGTGETQ